MDILFWYLLLTCFNNYNIFFLIETMVSVIYLVFAKINNKYVNKKNYLDEKKFKIGVFSGLITVKEFIETWIFSYIQKTFAPSRNVMRAYKLVLIQKICDGNSSRRTFKLFLKHTNIRGSHTCCSTVMGFFTFTLYAPTIFF